MLPACLQVYDQGYTLDASAIVDVWLSDDELVNVIKGGNRVVESYGLYLDQQLPAGDTHYFWVVSATWRMMMMMMMTLMAPSRALDQPAACAPASAPALPHGRLQDTFLNFYLHDPLFNRTDITPAEASLVMGLSASQWGEQVDASNIQSRMWPRACGAAERMWSDANFRDTDTVFNRLEAQRCRMVQRGIGAGPIRPADQVGFCPLPATSRFNAPHNPWSA